MPEFSLLTINAFGLPILITWRQMANLARELNRIGTEVICLQEVQNNAYLPLLQRRLEGYPYQAFEWRGFAPKGGLFTAARSPIEKSRFYPYPNRGRFLSIGFADWALFKGILVADFEVEGRRIIVMNTHLHANYTAGWQPKNPLARIQLDQVRTLVALIGAQPQDALVVVCGDFNFPRQTFLYDELMSNSGLSDPLAVDPRPTYRPLPMLKSKWTIPLDFVLYRAPQWAGLKITADIMPVDNSTGRSALTRFLTDHCALTLQASWRN